MNIYLLQKDFENLPVQKFELEDLHKLIKSFEKRVQKNQELRSKYPKNPEKFMDSEIEVNEDVTKLNKKPPLIDKTS